MNKTIVVRPEAASELEQAYGWYNKQSAGLGLAFEREILAVFEQIELNPMQFATLEPPVRRALTRRFPYAIFYMIDNDKIVILRIHHCRRKPIEWQRT